MLILIKFLVILGGCIHDKICKANKIKGMKQHERSFRISALSLFFFFQERKLSFGHVHSILRGP